MALATPTNVGPSNNSAPPSRGTMPPPPLRPAMTMQLPAPDRARAQNINDAAPRSARPAPRADSEQSNASHHPSAALSRSATSYVPQTSVPGHGALRADRSIASTAYNALTIAVQYPAAVPRESSVFENALQMDSQPLDSLSHTGLDTWDDRHGNSEAPQPTRTADISSFHQHTSTAFLPNPAMTTPSTDVLAHSRSAFIASLSETPALCGLSSAELERLVAQIVREEGFVKLVCASPFVFLIGS